MRQHKGPAGTQQATITQAAEDESVAIADRRAAVAASTAAVRLQFAGLTSGQEVDVGEVYEVGAAGLEGPAQELPHAARIQQSFGAHDVSGIQAHVGGEAATAADEIGADAYAMGNSVAFANAPDLHTSAHEAAHVVQQRAGIQLKGGIGEGGDTYEQEADRVADAVVAGESAAPLLGKYAPTASVTTPPAGVQRKLKTKDEKRAGIETQTERDMEKGREEAEDPTFAEMHEVEEDAEEIDGKKSNQAGFGMRLGNASREKAEKALESGAAPAFTQAVQPVDGPVRKSIAEQAKFVEDKTKKLKNEGSWGSTGLRSDPPSVDRRKKNSIKTANARISMLERHQFERWAAVNQYNDWRMMADGAWAARVEMIATADILGFDFSNEQGRAEFVEHVETGLDMANQLVDAKVLKGDKQKVSYANMDEDKGARTNAKPRAPGGESITEALSDATTNYNKLQVAHNGVYRHLLAQRSKVLEGKIGEKAGAIAEINGVIAFWNGVGGMVDTTVGEYKRAGQTGNEAAGALTHAGAKYYAYRNRKNMEKAAKKGLPPPRTDSEKTSYMKPGSLTLVDTQTESATETSEDMFGEVQSSGAGYGESKSSMSPHVPGLKPPTIGSAISTLVEWTFEDKLRDLQAAMVSLQGQLAAVKHVDDFIWQQSLLDEYRIAATAYKSSLEKLHKKKLEQREGQYKDLGSELDRYAYEHRGALKASGKGDLAVKRADREMYTPLLVTVAKIRQYRALAEAAYGTCRYDDYVTNATRLMDERNDPDSAPESAGIGSIQWSAPTVPSTTDAERAHLVQIESAYIQGITLAEASQTRFSGVEQRAVQLLQKLRQVETAEERKEVLNEY